MATGETKTKQYLRIEGVNFKMFLEDTLDLSIIRGGGLLLLKAAEEVAKAILESYDRQAELVNSGASVGIFSFSASATDAEAIRQAIYKSLRDNADLQHATFVVDTLPAGRSFSETRATLVTKNRWQQMQTLSVVYPKLPNRACHGQVVCEADHLRPAAHAFEHWDSEAQQRQTEALSESSFRRHEFGRAQRTGFYKREAGVKEDYDFADDLNQIGSSQIYGSLNRKVAVIHIDGNGFGRLFAKECDTAEKQGRASRLLRENQRSFLRRLFLEIEAHRKGWFYRSAPEERKQREEALRLETLLWGGDELRFVVPAWKGVYFLQLFYQEAAEWRLFDRSIALTHSAGLVFCNAKCNIHSASALAKELCEAAKGILNDENLVAYQVLESFDHIGQKVDAGYLRARYPFLNEDAAAVLLKADSLKKIWERFAELRDEVPRRRLHQVVRHLMANEIAPAQGVMKDTCHGMEKATLDRFREFARLLGGKDETWPAAWFHLSELWDYLGFEAWDFAEAGRAKVAAR